MSNMSVGFFAEDVPEKLIFAGKEVKFPEIYYRYAAAKSEFLPEVRSTVSQMENSFDSKIGSLDSFVEYGVAWVKDELEPLLKFTMDQLSLNGCYAISQDEFFQKYITGKLDEIAGIYDSMEEALDGIHREQEKKNAKRVAHREAKVAAGGDELGEMLLNGMKRGWDGVMNLTEAADIYNDTIQQKIKTEFIAICYSMVDSFADALYEYEKIDLRDPVSVDDYKRTRAMMKNLENNKIPESKVDDAAFEIFQKQPFMPEIIEWAVEHYGDPDGHFQEIADAFHIDISEKKKSILQSIYAKIDFSTEERLLHGKELLEAKEKELQITIDVFHSKINEKLKDFDLAARTVDGVEYESRELAGKARNLIDFYQTLDFSSEDNIIKSQKQFQEKEKELDFAMSSLEQEIADKLKLEDQNIRTVNGIEYATREEADSAKKQTAILSETIRNAALNTTDDVQALIDKIGATCSTIPAAQKAILRLEIYKEFIQFYPLPNLEIYRMLVSPKGKMIIFIALVIVGSILGSIWSFFGHIVILLWFVFLASLFFTTRKGLARRAEMFIQVKKYKLAAYCHALSNETLEEFLSK